MTQIKKIIQYHPVLAYFILTFAISWGGVLLLGSPYGMPTTQENFQKLWPIVFLPYLLGPTLSSLILTGVIDGKVGFRNLISRLLMWRVNMKWYMLALLTTPLLVLIILFSLSVYSPAYVPAIFTNSDKLGLLITGIVVGFFGGGFLEEPGWTGFAVPRLRLQHGLLSTGLITGFLWGLWHFLPTFWGSGDSSGVPSLSLLLPPCFFYAAILPAFRVLMVWVYDHTKSLLVVMLMHMSLTASTLFILAPSIQEIQLFLYYLVLAVVLWIGVMAVKMAANPERGILNKNWKEIRK
jgi:membrane protease YdiL (CAAX protease family)